MFRATMYSSSGETSTFMRHLELVIRYGCLSGMWPSPGEITIFMRHLLYIPDSDPYRVTSTKCRINILVSPDDGNIVAGNV